MHAHCRWRQEASAFWGSGLLCTAAAVGRGAEESTPCRLRVGLDPAGREGPALGGSCRSRAGSEGQPGPKSALAHRAPPVSHLPSLRLGFLVCEVEIRDVKELEGSEGQSPESPRKAPPGRKAPAKPGFLPASTRPGIRHRDVFKGNRTQLNPKPVTSSVPKKGQPVERNIRNIYLQRWAWVIESGHPGPVQNAPGEMCGPRRGGM